MNLANLLGAGVALLFASAPTHAQTTQTRPTAPPNGAVAAEAPASPAADPGRSKMPGAFGQMRADQLIGRNIYNMGGESLGEIEDIVMNRNDNAVAALVGMGRFLGAGEKKVAVLLSELDLQGGDIVVKNLTRTDFQQKPAYQANDWAKHDGDRLLGNAVR